VAIATLAPGRSQFGISLPLIFGLAVYALIVSHGAAVLQDPDTYLHIAVGRWIVAHGAVPHHGIFSFTMPEAVWVAHEWLGEVVIAWLFDHFGWHGHCGGDRICFATTPPAWCSLRSCRPTPNSTFAPSPPSRIHRCAMLMDTIMA